jgi:hypothetical protein
MVVKMTKINSNNIYNDNNKVAVVPSLVDLFINALVSAEIKPETIRNKVPNEMYQLANEMYQLINEID